MFTLFNYIRVKYHNMAHENNAKLPIQMLLNIYRVNGIAPYPSYKHPSSIYRELVDNKLINDKFHGNGRVPWYDTKELSQITVKGEKLIHPLVKIEKSFIHWFIMLICAVFVMSAVMSTTNLRFNIRLGHAIKKSTANFAINWGMTGIGIILLVVIGYICLKLINKIDLYKYNKKICVRKLLKMTHHRHPSHQRWIKLKH